MTAINRDTVAAALGIVAQAVVAILAQRNILTTGESQTAFGAVAAAWATFHLPNAAAKAALTITRPDSMQNLDPVVDPVILPATTVPTVPEPATLA